MSTKVLTCTQFGNPILRESSKKLSKASILSEDIQQLIKDMRATLITKKLGVGLAAPQVGHSIRLSVICIRPLPHRPDVESVDLVIINPEIIEFVGRKKPMWEGCVSSGRTTRSGLFAQVPRYRKVRLAYDDEHGKHHEVLLDGLTAHVAQHEVDHLNGILFVDKVKNTKSYMSYDEYKKYVTQVRRKKRI